MLEDLKNAIAEAEKELTIAKQNEELADPEFIEVAIEAYNIAFLKLNNLYKRAKLIQKLN